MSAASSIANPDLIIKKQQNLTPFQSLPHSKQVYFPARFSLR